MNTPTADRIGAFVIGRISTRSITVPMTNETTTVRTNAPQYGTPAWISVRQIYVDRVAISPCAKFT